MPSTVPDIIDVSSGQGFILVDKLGEFEESDQEMCGVFSGKNYGVAYRMGQQWKLGFKITFWLLKLSFGFKTEKFEACFSN